MEYNIYSTIMKYINAWEIAKIHANAQCREIFQIIRDLGFLFGQRFIGFVTLFHIFMTKNYEEKERKRTEILAALRNEYAVFFKMPDKSRPIEIIRRARPSALAYRFLIRSNRNGFGKRLSSSRDNTLLIGNRVCQPDFRAESSSYPPSPSPYPPVRRLRHGINSNV